MSLRGARLQSLSEDARDANGHLKLFWSRGALTAIAFAVVGVALASGAVPCAFARVTHMPCPGCGSTRAVHALLDGDLPRVVHTNLLGPILGAIVVVLAIGSTASVFRTGTTAAFVDSRAGALLSRVAIVVAVLEVVLWIARFFGAFGGPVAV